VEFSLNGRCGDRKIAAIHIVDETSYGDEKDWRKEKEKRLLCGRRIAHGKKVGGF